MSSMHRLSCVAQCNMHGSSHRAASDVGDYKMSARSSDYDGWLLCDGRALEIAANKELFEILGTSFGSNDATSFKLPDFRGRVPGMPGAVPGLTTRAMGDVVGTEMHALGINEMPVHAHSGTTNPDGSHTHTASLDAAAAHTHTVTDPGHAHTQETVNDTFTSSSGNPPGFTTDSAGSHTWSNISTSTTGITLGASGAHTHTATIVGAANHTHGFTTATAGQGHAHNNMQPTLFGVNLFLYTGN